MEVMSYMMSGLIHVYRVVNFNRPNHCLVDKIGRKMKWYVGE